MGVTRKLVAVLYADVAGYSRLTGADEVGTHKQLSASLDLIARSIEAAKGRVVHYAGDAVLAEFQSVVKAVETAFSVQRSLAEMGAEIDEEKRIKYRIGINLGEAIERLGRATAFNPNYALAYHGLGYALALGGSPGEAVAQFDKALCLSPQDSYRWAFLAMRAFALMLNKEYKDAVEWGRRAISERPGVFWSDVHVTSALGHLERHEESAQAFAELLKVKPDFSSATIDETIRFRRIADREHLLKDFRKAGLQQ